MKQVMVIVPASKSEAANHTHIALGKAKDVNTYVTPNYQAPDGKLFHVSYGQWSDVQIAGVKNPLILGSLELPENSKADMAKVAAAQADFAFVERVVDQDGEWVLSAPIDLKKITAVQCSDPHRELALVGLTQIEVAA